MPIRLIYKLTGTENLRDLWAHIHSHDAHPLIQFAKYGLVGGLATGVFAGTFILSNTYWFSADQSLPSTTRTINYVISNGIAFIVSNGVAYYLNVLWVFKSGRHSRWKELTLFLTASFIAFMIGTPLGAYLIKAYGVYEYLALGVTIVASVMVNFLARKFIVFKG